MKIRHIALFVALAFAVGACAQTQDGKGAAKKMTTEQVAAKAKAKKMAKAAKAAKTKALVASNTKATLTAYEKYKKDAAMKKDAMKAMKKAEKAKKKAAKKAMAKANAKIAAKMPSVYTAYFDFNSATISEEAREILKKAAFKAASSKSTRVVITGYADTSGSARYNHALAEKRVKAVDRVLRWEGVNWLVIEPAVMGEKNPAEKTGDSVKNFQNRRVVIDIKK